MNDNAASEERLAEAACVLAGEIPLATIRSLVAMITKAGARKPARQRLSAIPHAQFRASAARFLDEWEHGAAEIGAEVAVLALRTAALAQERHRRLHSAEAVWTGPAASGSTFRRTEQAILQVLDSAMSQLTVVSYAVYKIPNIRAALVRAAARGVSIRIIIETPDKLEGAGEYSTLKALGPKVAASATVYFWPAEQRMKSENGKPGILHVKCAVADGHLLFLSSANLTSYAFDVNMELGLLITGGILPTQIETHFERLILNGILEAI